MTDDAQQFASDNYSGICPEAWAAMAAANAGHAPAYGEDAWTARAADAFRTLFESRCEVFFAFNGTAANALALASLCRSYHSVICADAAHVETDECGAPEFFSNGSKLLTVRTESGKLTPLDVKAGDKVLFGKWSGTEVKIDGQDLLIMKESDIMGVVEKTLAKKVKSLVGA